MDIGTRAYGDRWPRRHRVLGGHVIRWQRRHCGGHQHHVVPRAIKIHRRHRRWRGRRRPDRRLRWQVVECGPLARPPITRVMEYSRWDTGGEAPERPAHATWQGRPSHTGERRGAQCACLVCPRGTLNKQNGGAPVATTPQVTRPRTCPCLSNGQSGVWGRTQTRGSSDMCGVTRLA